MNVLELEHITKSFGGVRAVNRVALELDPGKVTALIGPNGAGKTTVFNLISGFLRPNEGAVRYRGEELTGLKPWQIAQRGIGRLFQDVRLFGRMTVRNNVLSAFGGQRGESALLSVLIPWTVARQERRLTERAMELLGFVGLAEKADELGENLSYGQQKLVAIARLLAADADVLLLDEPTAGVHPQLAEKLLETIRTLARGGKTVVVIEHNMKVVLEIADWIYFMDDGEVAASGRPHNVLSDPDVRAAYMGMEEMVVKS